MAEPVFKLLRCDAEASHMLGWAKKQVKRLVEHAKLDSFQRSWSLGDVSIRANYFGGVARLWLEAAGTERMAVWATLPNPVPYRWAEVVYTADAYAVGIQGEYHTPWGLVASDWEVLSNSENITYNYSYQTTVSVVDPNAFIYLHQQQYGDPAQYMRWIGGPTLDAYTIEFGGVAYSDVMHAYPAHIQIEPLPEDVVTSNNTVPEWPGDYPFSGTTYPGVLAFPYFSVEAEPKTTWSARQAEQGALGVARHQAWKKGISDAVISGLRSGKFNLPFRLSGNGTNPAAGRLPLDITYALKRAAPNSQGVYRTLKMEEPETVDVEISPVVDSVLWAGYPASRSVYRTERTTTFRYERRVHDGSITTEEVSLSGTRVLTNIGLSGFQFYTVEYADWYCEEDTLEFKATGIFQALNKWIRPRIPQEEVVAGDHGQVWNGKFTGSFARPGTAAGVYHIDTYYTAPSFRATSLAWIPTLLAHGDGYYWTDGFAVRAAPIKYENTLRSTLPSPIKDWHAQNPPRYKKGAGEDYMYAEFDSSSTIAVIPIVFVEADQPLGMFADITGSAELEAVEVYGQAVYKYDADVRDFVFSEWKPLPDGQTSTRVYGDDLLSRSAYNAILIYGGIKWDDVKEDARAQRKALNDPEDPAHDPLMKAVLDALKPPEPAP